MKNEDIDALEKIIQEVSRTGNTAMLAQVGTAQLVADLLKHHKEIVRAETFWGNHAPAMNEELLALRPLELFARLIANGGVLSKVQRDELSTALVGLDRVRGARPARVPVAANDVQTITAADVGSVSAILAGRDGASREKS